MTGADPEAVWWHDHTPFLDAKETADGDPFLSPQSR